VLVAVSSKTAQSVRALVADLVIPRTVGLAVPLGWVNGKRVEGGAAGAVAIGARGGDTPVGVVVVVIRGSGIFPWT